MQVPEELPQFMLKGAVLRSRAREVADPCCRFCLHDSVSFLCRWNPWSGHRPKKGWGVSLAHHTSSLPGLLHEKCNRVTSGTQFHEQKQLASRQRL